MSPKTATPPPDVVGVVEIADRLGVQQNTISMWRQRHESFPQPRWHVSKYPAWEWSDVVEWLEATGRGDKVPKK